MSFISNTNRTSGERSGIEGKAQLSERESDVAQLDSTASTPTQRGQRELSESKQPKCRGTCTKEKNAELQNKAKHSERLGKYSTVEE